MATAVKHCMAVHSKALTAMEMPDYMTVLYLQHESFYAQPARLVNGHKKVGKLVKDFPTTSLFILYRDTISRSTYMPLESTYKISECTVVSSMNMQHTLKAFAASNC